MSAPEIRRVVTGHDEQGRAVVVSDKASGRVPRDGVSGHAPCRPLSGARRSLRRARRAKAAGQAPGGRQPVEVPGVTCEFRSVDRLHHPAGRHQASTGPNPFSNLVWTTATSPADNMDDIDGAPREAGVTVAGGTVFRIGKLEPGHRSPMHRTLSIDYGIVLDGRLVLELDGGDRVELAAGDVVVQRGTNHIWANESDEPCTVTFILIDAEPVVEGRELAPTPLTLPEPEQA